MNSLKNKTKQKKQARAPYYGRTKIMMTVNHRPQSRALCGSGQLHGSCVDLHVFTCLNLPDEVHCKDFHIYLLLL